MFGLMVASVTAAKSIDDYAEESVSRLSAYLKIDTINPPGNETRGVGYLSKILESEGIAYEVVESAPNRGNLDISGYIYYYHHPQKGTHD